MKALRKFALLLLFAYIFTGFLPVYAQRPALNAHAGIVIDAATGTEIMAKNADTIMYPASTTKIMTALLAIEYGDLDISVKIGNEVNLIAWDSSRAHLQPGDSISLRDLLYGMMLASGNDAAYAVAVHIARVNSGNAQLSAQAALKEFSRMMNERARQLGAVNTSFVNPDGYPHSHHLTTARDLALITAEAMKLPEFRDIVQTASFQPETWQGGAVRTWTNGNHLIRKDSDFYYAKATGGKTGYTVPAGFTMVATAREADLELVAVALNTDAHGRWLDSTELLEYGFREYTPQPPVVYVEDVMLAEAPEAVKKEEPEGIHVWVKLLVKLLADLARPPVQ